MYAALFISHIVFWLIMCCAKKKRKKGKIKRHRYRSYFPEHTGSLSLLGVCGGENYWGLTLPILSVPAFHLTRLERVDALGHYCLAGVGWSIQYIAFFFRTFQTFRNMHSSVFLCFKFYESFEWIKVFLFGFRYTFWLSVCITPSEMIFSDRKQSP